MFWCPVFFPDTFIKMTKVMDSSARHCGEAHKYTCKYSINVSSSLISISLGSLQLTHDLLDVDLPKTQASLPKLLSGAAGSYLPPRKDRNKQRPPLIEWWKQNTAAVKGYSACRPVQCPLAFYHIYIKERKLTMSLPMSQFKKRKKKSARSTIYSSSLS